jgi:hypothetical protein
MARILDREKAIQLRLKDKSYSQIKAELGISKSTLSGWLKNHPLSEERIRELRDRNSQRIEKFRETMRKKHQVRLETVYKEQKRILLPLTKRELFIAGLFLYWGEGSKSSMTELIFANTNPQMCKFYICWLTKNLNVPRKKVRIRLQLYSDMDVKKEMGYWSNILRIPIIQFRKPQIKLTSSKRINYKGTFGHGTCDIIVGSVLFGEQVFMGLKAISDSIKT